MEKGIAAAVGFQPAAKVAPSLNLMHGFKLDQLFQHGGGGMPVDFREHQETAVEPGREQVAKIPDAAAEDDATPDETPNKWSVQVGAYGHYSLAHAAALKAKRATPLLAKATIAIARARAGGVTLYRARLTGLSEGQARAACGQLHHRMGECVLINPSNERLLAQVSQ